MRGMVTLTNILSLKDSEKLGKERIVAVVTRLEQAASDTTERVATLEGAYGHLATKADLERLEKVFTERMAEIEVRMTRWLVGTMIAGFALVIAALKLPPIG